MDKRYGIKLAVILFTLLMLVIAVIGWWRARTQGIPVSIWSVVKWYQAVFIPFIFPLVAMAAIVVISCWVLPWLVRPWLITHVRRAICDLGYAEVCRRCGYLCRRRILRPRFRLRNPRRSPRQNPQVRYPCRVPWPSPGSRWVPRTSDPCCSEPDHPRILPGWHGLTVGR